MLSPLHELHRMTSDAVSTWTELLRHAPLPWIRAQASLLHRITKGYPKPAFSIPGVVEEVVLMRPFCRLVHFAAPHARQVPRGLVIAPLSGHHATLVRDTIATLLQDHDVFVTDWIDAREVPLAHGAFSLDTYVTELRGFIQHLGATQLHIVAVCQPTVPALAAVSLDAAAGAPAPRSLVMMNPDKHAQAYWQYWLARWRGDEAAAALHEKFYDEYNAVLDMDAQYYLDTVRIVFQEFALARGAWRLGGELVDPSRITATPIFTIEGELDDISGLGQTAAALELATHAPVKRELVAAGCGHYGLFSGSRWRDAIYPEVRAWIGENA